MAVKDKIPSLARKLPLIGRGKTGKAGAADLLTDEERKRRRRKAAALLAILAVLIVIAIILIIRALTGSTPLPGIPSDLPHYVSSIYGVNEPMGVAVSPSGDRIYVTESEGRRLVRVYDSSGNEVGRLKPPGHNNAARLPVYVAVSPQTEDVYVSDRLREVVEVYDPNGKYLRAFRPAGRLGKGANPLGLAFGPEGDLYMTDVSGGRKHHQVLVFGSSGEKPQRRIGSRGVFWFPNGLVVDSSGDVYVADSNNGRLAIFNPAGELVSFDPARGGGRGPRPAARGGDRRRPPLRRRHDLPGRQGLRPPRRGDGSAEVRRVVRRGRNRQRTVPVPERNRDRRQRADLRHRS